MPSTAQIEQLSALGFLQTNTMGAYPFQQSPCQHCPDSGSHSLFATWADGFPAPRFWCQKLAAEVPYKWQTEGRPKRDRAVVTCMADVRGLRRWIATKGKRPAKWVSPEGRTGWFTFSHSGTKCGRFESPDTTAESFVRVGGACLQHLMTSGKTVKRYPTIGWGTFEAVKELGFPRE